MASPPRGGSGGGSSIKGTEEPMTPSFDVLCLSKAQLMTVAQEFPRSTTTSLFLDKQVQQLMGDCEAGVRQLSLLMRNVVQHCPKRVMPQERGATQRKKEQK